MKQTFLTAIFLAVFLGCGTPKVAYDSTKRPPTTEIDIFRDGQKPTKAYKEIGMVTDDGKIVEQPNIGSKFIKKAKSMGGNAIIMYAPTRCGQELSGFGLVDTYLYKASVLTYE
jgi:hypothetical protein